MNPRDIDLNLLVAFEAIWQLRNVTAAAERMRTSQSAMSNALRRLRKLFDDPLFIATRAGMAPTPMAAQLAEPIGQALELLSAGLSVRARFDPATSEREFTIGMTDVGEIVFLPELLAYLARAAPGVSVKTMSPAAPEMRSGMESGLIDLAVGFIPALRAGFYRQRLFTQRYVCLLGSRWRLHGERLTLEQFRNARHALVDAEGTGHAIVEHMLEAAGIRRSVHLRAPHFVAIPFVVEATDLIVTAPEKLGTVLSARLALRVLPHPIKLPEFQVNQFWHRRYHQDPANKWLRMVFAKLFRN